MRRRRAGVTGAAAFCDAGPSNAAQAFETTYTPTYVDSVLDLVKGPAEPPTAHAAAHGPRGRGRRRRAGTTASSSTAHVRCTLSGVAHAAVPPLIYRVLVACRADSLEQTALRSKQLPLPEKRRRTLRQQRPDRTPPRPRALLVASSGPARACSGLPACSQATWRTPVARAREFRRR